MRIAFAALALVVAAASCGGTDEPSWDGPPRLEEGGRLDTSAFNAYLDEVDGDWERSPVAVAAVFADVKPGEQRTTTIESRAAGRVLVTRDRLFDDSVRAVRYELELERQEDRWRLRSARWAVRCWPRRGHQDFSSELCV